MEGPLPSNIGDLSGLTKLDLLMNKITGSIPSTISRLPKLSYLDVSMNKITGAVPLLPWDQYTFLVMTVERPQPSLQERLRAHGYHRVCNMAEDMLFVHKSFPGGVAAVVERVRAAALRFRTMSNVTHDVSFS